MATYAENNKVTAARVMAVAGVGSLCATHQFAATEIKQKCLRKVPVPPKDPPPAHLLERAQAHLIIQANYVCIKSRHLPNLQNQNYKPGSGSAGGDAGIPHLKTTRAHVLNQD